MLDDDDAICKRALSLLAHANLRFLFATMRVALSSSVGEETILPRVGERREQFESFGIAHFDVANRTGFFCSLFFQRRRRRRSPSAPTRPLQLFSRFFFVSRPRVASAFRAPPAPSQRDRDLLCT